MTPKVCLHCDRPVIARSMCKSHWSKWRRQQPDRDQFLEKQRKQNKAKPDRHLKSRYGISKKDYLTLLTLQNHQCKICGVVLENMFSAYTDKMKIARVDHCHKTGKVRGLLCHSCNIGLGAFKDNTTVLKSALLYLSDT